MPSWQEARTRGRVGAGILVVSRNFDVRQPTVSVRIIQKKHKQMKHRNVIVDNIERATKTLRIMILRYAYYI